MLQFLERMNEIAGGDEKMLKFINEVWSGYGGIVVAAGDELLWSSDNLLGHARRFDQESHVSD